ncbi:hypothetical protein IJV79_02395 [bacterium]|nr:hypothetical protein [bacterium]
MSIGPKDSLEEFIVKRYAQKQVNSPRIAESVVDPDRMMVSMNNYALAGKCMAVIGRKISALNYALNAANADYSKRKDLAHVLSITLALIVTVIAV